MYLNYKFKQGNGVITQASVNADHVLQCIPVLDEQGFLRHIQLLLNGPTSLEYEPYPVKGRFDKHNKVVMDKRGNQEVTFQNKMVQKHIFILIDFKEDHEKFLKFFGIDQTFEYQPVES